MTGFFKAGANEAVLDIIINRTVFFDTEKDNGNSGAAKLIDWDDRNKQKITLTGNTTITFDDPQGPTSLLLRVVQDATGSRTITWPATVKWPGGATPALSGSSNAVDLVGLYFDGTNYYGNVSLDFS